MGFEGLELLQAVIGFKIRLTFIKGSISLYLLYYDCVKHFRTTKPSGLNNATTTVRNYKPQTPNY